MFSWIPLYEEIARKVLEFENDQRALIAVLKRLETKGLKVISLLDEDANGVKFPLEEIDPFTFFASFNRSTTSANRCAVLAALKGELQIAAEVPALIEGIPLMIPQSAWFFAYAPARGADDLWKLWALARETVGRTRENFSRSVLDAALSVKRCGLAKLTMGMFWLNPRAFLAAETHNVVAAKRAGIAPPQDSADGYFSWLDAVIAKLGSDLPTISRRAYEQPEDESDRDRVREAPEKFSQRSQRYWWLNANPKIWDFASVQVGETQTYTSHNEKGNKRQRYQCFAQVQPGDLVLGYVTTPAKEIVALCEITRGLHTAAKGESIEFRKIENFRTPLSWEMLQANPQLRACEPLVSNQGSLFAITEAEFEIIRALIDEQNVGLTPARLPRYTKTHALADLFADEAEFDTMLARLRRKKNLVLTGPPGVGKTFVAKRLAFAAMGERDDSRVAMVQFHQSYSYEDFIQGFRPRDQGGFQRRSGVFYEFARRAQRDFGRDYFFIIDEINRGNLSKIFGELMMLLEADKRGPEHALPLTYAENGDDTFYLPANLHLVGTMNTADRSLALVDYALRRRFAFFDLRPKFDSARFGDWLRAAGADETLVRRVQRGVGALNEEIAGTPDLGRGFCIGHSYFCPAPGVTPDAAWLHDVIEAEVAPLLEEYFDKPETARELIGQHLV